MDDTLTRIWQDLGGRIGGPMTFRLILQPVMAAIFAVRDGLVDARAGRPPYFWAILHDSSHRMEVIRQGWKAIARIFGLAVVMDAIYQVVALGWFYLGEALLVAFVLACVPYLLIRGPVSRIARMFQRRRAL